MEKFENFKLEKISLTTIYGGAPLVDTCIGNYCDCLEDTNGNGKADPGECMEIVPC